ncbi:MAG: hypothetical protein JWQ92_1882, partial [Amnibacterium sp.]|nr:hypothetical protein [Amnibacterium sp.]
MTASISVTDLVARPAAQASRRSSSDGGTAFQTALDAQSAGTGQDAAARATSTPEAAREGAAPDQRSAVEQRERIAPGDRPADAADGPGRPSHQDRAKRADDGAPGDAASPDPSGAAPTPAATLMPA